MRRHVAAFVVLALAGCAKVAPPVPDPAPDSVSPYYTTIDRTIGTKSGRLYFGHCPVHGMLTNSVEARWLVADAVESHNRKYHSDGVDPDCAKVYLGDE